MVLKIRLARFGRKHAPIYNIVVSQARTARNSKPIEVLGTYDPIPKTDPTDSTSYKDIRLDTARAKYWLGVGAQPSDPAWRLLSMRGLLEPKYKGIIGAIKNESGGKREQPKEREIRIERAAI